MISRIALACAIAAFWYVIAPALCQLFLRNSRRRAIDELRARERVFAHCDDYAEGALTLRPIGDDARGDANIRVVPKRARFFSLTKSGGLERIAWKDVFLVQKGVGLAYYPAGKGVRRAICLFHEEASGDELAARIDGLDVPDRVPHPSKYFCVATGVFLEFCVLVESLGHDDMTRVAIAAVTGIFGKALPYCPPGLFFTLAYYLNRQKKGRRRKVIGYLLFTVGILLNIAVIFFVIQRIGLGEP